MGDEEFCPRLRYIMPRVFELARVPESTGGNRPGGWDARIKTQVSYRGLNQEEQGWVDVEMNVAFSGPKMPAPKDPGDTLGKGIPLAALGELRVTLFLPAAASGGEIANKTLAAHNFVLQANQYGLISTGDKSGETVRLEIIAPTFNGAGNTSVATREFANRAAAVVAGRIYEEDPRYIEVIANYNPTALAEKSGK